MKAMWYSSIGPREGPLIYNEALLAVRVTRTRRSRVAMGAAFCVGRGQTGAALWKLTIGNVEVPGRWIIVDRKFQRAESAPGRAFTPSGGMARVSTLLARVLSGHRVALRARPLLIKPAKLTCRCRRRPWWAKSPWAGQRRGSVSRC